MAVLNTEFLDFLRLVEERPEWRSELRRVVLTDELVELPTIVRELAEAQRRTEARVEELAEAQRRTEARVEELAAAQRRTEELLQSVVMRQDQMEKTLESLTLAQRNTTLELQEVVRVQEKMAVRLGRLTGDVMELRYEHRVSSYFGFLLRKSKVADWTELDEALQERLTRAELRDLLKLDLLVKGMPRDLLNLPELYIALEISAVIDTHDVERAIRRAALLRKAGYHCIPAVAGEETTFGAKSLTRSEHVLLMTDGDSDNWDAVAAAWAAAQ